MEEKIAQ